MSQVTISKETKRSLLSLIEKGERIPDWYLPFLGSDMQFAEAAVKRATESENSNFVIQVKEYISCFENNEPDEPSGRWPKKRNEKRKTSKKKKTKRPVNPRVKAVYDAIKHIPIRRSPNYSPTGTSFKDFMKMKGHPIDTHPNSTGYIHFVQGGSPGTGKRA